MAKNAALPRWVAVPGAGQGWGHRAAGGLSPWAHPAVGAQPGSGAAAAEHATGSQAAALLLQNRAWKRLGNGGAFWWGWTRNGSKGWILDYFLFFKSSWDKMTRMILVLSTLEMGGWSQPTFIFWPGGVHLRDQVKLPPSSNLPEPRISQRSWWFWSPRLVVLWSSSQVLSQPLGFCWHP